MTRGGRTCVLRCTQLPLLTQLMYTAATSHEQNRRYRRFTFPLLSTNRFSLPRLPIQCPATCLASQRPFFLNTQLVPFGCCAVHPFCVCGSGLTSPPTVSSFESLTDDERFGPNLSPVFDLCPAPSPFSSFPLTIVDRLLGLTPPPSLANSGFSGPSPFPDTAPTDGLGAAATPLPIDPPVFLFIAPNFPCATTRCFSSAMT